MFTAKLTGVQCVSLKAVLENHPPKNLSSLKVMDLVRKAYEKIEVVAEEIFTLQQTINEETKNRQESFKKMTTDEEKSAAEKEANDVILPLLEKRKELYEKIYEVNFSEEQHEFMVNNFKTSIADNFNKVKDVLDLADALEVPLEEEKK